ncbi:MAG TPA: nuclear transport factor 2 family protein [Hyphomicrobium sp.]
MRARERVVLEALYASWAAKDLNAVLSCCSEDIVFAIHVPPEVMPFAGETRGKDALVPRLQMILDDFDFLKFRPLHIVDEGDVTHSQVHYHFRHKATGYDIEGTMRHVWKIEGDQIVRLEEFHDTPRVSSFFELLAQSESGKPLREFPNIKRNK